MKVQVLHKLNREVEIIMPQELQSKDYADEYLAIQHLCDESFETVRVVFENTMWIDNLPMLQLFLYIKKFKMLGKKVYFEFHVEPDVTEQVRFIKYMEDYGFFKIIEELADAYDNTVLDKAYSGNGYSDMKKGDFEYSECFMPFQIITKKEDVAEFINETMENLNCSFNNQYSGYEMENLVFRISIFLQETMGNVFEHAFNNSEDAFCGVMIRYIHKKNRGNGILKRRNYLRVKESKNASLPFRNATFTIKEHRMLAEKYNPYRNKIGMKVLEKYMQIFVTDIGMGLMKSMGYTDPKDERTLINEIFEKGHRSDNKPRNTVVGGLGTLYQLLQKKENYISIKGEYNWAQIACAKKKDYNDTLPYVHKGATQSKDVLKGLTVIGYIDCDDERKKELFIPTSSEIIDNLYKEEYILSNTDERTDVDIIDFRLEIPDLSKKKLKNKTVLCLVGQNIEKAIWCNRITSLVTEIDSDDITLILADIPEREMRKYELIFEKSQINVNKIILLTNSLELALFRKGNNNRLDFDGDATRRYQIVKDLDITKSLYGLLKEIRRHDSVKFWRTVSETQKNKEARLFVNNEVVWDVEGNNRMDGYLDFSQACFDEKIKKLLICQVFRVPNCQEDGNYFMSMDRFTEDLCEKINGKLKIPFKNGENQSIHLGSVYVTGTSSKMSKIDIKHQEKQEYYFFRHPLITDSNISRIKALLMWPSKEIANKFFGVTDAEENLIRLSKTPFLAPHGTNYFAQQHYTDIKDSIDLKVDELYGVIQEESLWTNRLVKMAHIDMLGYHDYISLNARTIFDKHYMESRHCAKYLAKNSFDYLLKQMYIALGRTARKSYERTIEVDIQPQYRKIVLGKIKESDIPQDKGLFVYLTDYETMEIVAKLKEVFSDEMQKRIIPIAPVSKKRGSSALLLSPILMENIKGKLLKIYAENDGQDSRVTVFMATVTSTTLQRELKHILYRLGANQIKCISLVDRQRFPLGSREKESYNSFCKVDLPHLGSEDRCKLCIGINQINNLKSKLLSKELQKRCSQIVFRWGKVKVSDSMYEKGVQAQSIMLSQNLKKHILEICKAYQIEEIAIDTDIGIVLFAVEHAAITMSIDFLMSCLKDDSLSDNIKILLITAHLVLFSGEEIVPADKYNLVERLYKLLQCQSESNEYTGLACIMILSQKEKVKRKLHEYYKGQWKYQHFNNVDFIIASVGVACVVEKEERDDMLDYWVKKSEEVPFDYLYGICLFTNGNRSTRHGTMLSRARETGWSLSQLDFLSADNDASFLEMAYRYLPLSYFKHPDSCQIKKMKFLEKITSVRELLERAVKTGLTHEEREKLSYKVNEMFQCASYLNEEIFMSSEEMQLLELRRKLQELVKNNKESDVTCYVNNIQCDKTIGVKYFCYMEDLQREILYLIRDFRHSDKNALIRAQDGNCYNVLIDIIFEKECMRYRFRNYVSDSFCFERVKKQKELKYNRPTIVSLQMLWAQNSDGHLFEYNYDKEEKMFTVELKIPYFNV